MVSSSLLVSCLWKRTRSSSDGPTVTPCWPPAELPGHLGRAAAAAGILLHRSIALHPGQCPFRAHTGTDVPRCRRKRSLRSTPRRVRVLAPAASSPVTQLVRDSPCVSVLVVKVEVRFARDELSYSLKDVMPGEPLAFK